MRKSSALCLLYLLLVLPASMQAHDTVNVDSLKRLLKTEKRDTNRVNLLFDLTKVYILSRPDTALILAQQALVLARNAGYVAGELRSLNILAGAFLIGGNYPKALELFLEALQKAESVNDKLHITRFLGNIGNVYIYQGDYKKAAEYSTKAVTLARSIGYKEAILTYVLNLGDIYEKLNQLDSAKAYTEQAYQMAVQQKAPGLTAIALNNFGNIYGKMGRHVDALHNYQASFHYYKEVKDDDGLCEAYLGIAQVFQKNGNRDSSLHYAKLSFVTAQKGGFTKRVMKASQFLTDYYRANHQLDSAFVYQSKTIAAKDSLFSQEKQRQIQDLTYEENLRQQQLEQARAEARTQLKFNALLGSLFTLCVVAFLLWRNNRQKQKAQMKIEKAYTELKATQQQLIQQEKMASLGELAAGIAHEIRNPLNFINNFAETNTELIEEAQTCLYAKNTEETAFLLNSIKANEVKIAHHGKRADNIVKGMLQHAKTSTGKKEPIDITALVEEYLRLSYQGMRAKDKTFYATMETSFDQHVGNVAVVPQDVGRVLLNLFNNAFYAVRQKKAQLNGTFEPTVSVSTKRAGNHVLVTVKDNGTGMPQHVTNKVFQPFFSTKPTGEGTGLGLSLSYDIITKGHGGSLSVQSVEGEGSEFVIALPAT